MVNHDQKIALAALEHFLSLPSRGSKDRAGDFIERLTGRLSRIPCRLLSYHTLACRGRTDHDPNIGKWTTRW